MEPRDSLARDARRTGELDARGYRVLRFWNNDVLSNVEGVMETISRRMRRETLQEPPTPDPSPAMLAWRGGEPRAPCPAGASGVIAQVEHRAA